MLSAARTLPADIIAAQPANNPKTPQPPAIGSDRGGRRKPMPYPA